MPKSNVLLKRITLLLVVVGSLVFLPRAYNQQEQREQTSYGKVDCTESFESIMARMTAAKSGIESEHLALLNERYGLSDRLAQGVTMDRGRLRLASGMLTQKNAQILDYTLEPTGIDPAAHLLINYGSRRQVIGQHPPMAAGLDNIAQPVEHHAKRILPLLRILTTKRQIRRYKDPLPFCHTTRIAVSITIPHLPIVLYERDLSPSS